MFLLPILKVDPAQNLAKLQRWLEVPTQLINRSIMQSCIVNDHKEKDVRGHGPSLLNLFACFFGIKAWFFNHFPL